MEAGTATIARPPPSWGASWLKLIAGEGWLEGMRAGQRMLLEHSVRGLDLRAGVIEAAVTGGKTKPQRVQFRLAPVVSAEWARLVRQVLEDHADVAACTALEGGQLPVALVDAADRHGVPLLPRRLVHVITACTCGGAQLPCDHVLAVHLAVGRKLDEEPTAILVFRGGLVSELLALFDRVRDELQVALPTASPVAELDPFAPEKGLLPTGRSSSGPRLPVPCCRCRRAGASGRRWTRSFEESWRLPRRGRCARRPLSLGTPSTSVVDATRSR